MSDYLKYCSEDAANVLETSASLPAILREPCEPMIAHGTEPAKSRSQPPDYTKSTGIKATVYAVEHVIEYLGCNTISVWSTRELAEQEVTRPNQQVEPDPDQFMITPWALDEGDEP